MKQQQICGTGKSRNIFHGLIIMSKTSRPHGRDVTSILPFQEHSCQPVQLSLCRAADTALDHVLKLNVLGLLWSSQHNLQPASLTLSWAWGQNVALLMLLGFLGVCSYEQENLTEKHNKMLKPEVLQQVWITTWPYIRVKTCPGYRDNIYFYINTIKSECDVSVFLPIFPSDDLPQFCSLAQHSYGPCFVSSSPVHQQDQSLRLEGTGLTPCEDWVINLQ